MGLLLQLTIIHNVQPELVYHAQKHFVLRDWTYHPLLMTKQHLVFVPHISSR